MGLLIDKIARKGKYNEILCGPYSYECDYTITTRLGRKKSCEEYDVVLDETDEILVSLLLKNVYIYNGKTRTDRRCITSLSLLGKGDSSDRLMHQLHHNQVVPQPIIQSLSLTEVSMGECTDSELRACEGESGGSGDVVMMPWSSITSDPGAPAPEPGS